MVVIEFRGFQFFDSSVSNQESPTSLRLIGISLALVFQTIALILTGVIGIVIGAIVRGVLF